jgi:hypothetical protein
MNTESLQSLASVLRHHFWPVVPLDAPSPTSHHLYTLLLQLRDHSQPDLNIRQLHHIYISARHYVISHHPSFSLLKVVRIRTQRLYKQPSTSSQSLSFSPPPLPPQAWGSNLLLPYKTLLVLPMSFWRGVDGLR